jgi:N-acetylmuramoyl-L-alanine amidase
MEIIHPNLKFPRPLIPLALEKIQFIVIHHAATIKCTIQDIHRWHLERGWNGCGYCEFINKDGITYIGRGDSVGSHTSNYNRNGYGICLEGNFEVETMPIKQSVALIERLRHHLARMPNIKSIVGHSGLGHKTSCPGKNVNITHIYGEVYKKLKKITDIGEAVDILFEAKIISSTDYWRKTLDVVQWQKELFLNMANYIKSEI